MLAITPLVLWGLGFDNPQANWHYILFMIIAVGIFYFKPIGRITFLLVSLYIILFNRYSWFNGVLYFSESDMVILLVLDCVECLSFQPLWLPVV